MRAQRAPVRAELRRHPDSGGRCPEQRQDRTTRECPSLSQVNGRTLCALRPPGGPPRKLCDRPWSLQLPPRCRQVSVCLFLMNVLAVAVICYDRSSNGTITRLANCFSRFVPKLALARTPRSGFLCHAVFGWIFPSSLP